MSAKICFIIDPIDSLNPKKDSSLAMIEAAIDLGYEAWVMEAENCTIQDGISWGQASPIKLTLGHDHWYTLGEAKRIALGAFDVIMMRKDPPVDAAYIHCTQVLDFAARAGAHIVNNPSALRSLNEKLFAVEFPELCPPHLVSSSTAAIGQFAQDQPEIILKPLDGMGGKGIVKTHSGHPKLSEQIENLTASGTQAIMAQRYLPEIVDGDKRVLMIAGQPGEHLLARIPAPDDFRGNLAAGATGEVRPLGETERHITRIVGPALVKHGILFAGLDIIGDHLTEINITSPTCIREIDAGSGSQIATDLINSLNLA